jgi:hypothetical protein
MISYSKTNEEEENSNNAEEKTFKSDEKSFESEKKTLKSEENSSDSEESSDPEITIRAKKGKIVNRNKVKKGNQENGSINKRVFNDNDMKFIEDLYNGKSKYKKAHQDLSNSVNDYMHKKWSQLMKVEGMQKIIDMSTNITKNVAKNIDKAEKFDTNDFLHDWYKKDYKTSANSKRSSADSGDNKLVKKKGPKNKKT